MPHVAHLTTVHHPQDPRIFHKQCKTLRDAGYGVHLVAQRETSATVDGIRIHALPVVEGRRARLRLQPYVYRIARSIPASVYHIHDPELIPLLWLLKQTTGAVVIYDMHEDYIGGTAPYRVACCVLWSAGRSSGLITHSLQKPVTRVSVPVPCVQSPAQLHITVQIVTEHFIRHSGYTTDLHRCDL